MNDYEKYIGQIFDDRYRIEALLGVGGMAAVLYAYDQKDQKYVAVKLLKEELCGSKESVSRFINESKTVAMMHHPNIVKVIDVSITEKMKYLVMEYIEGESLRAYMDRVKQIPIDRSIDIIKQVLKGLAHAHEQGVIHRDIKPQNIILKGNKAIVTDFGIAMIAQEELIEEKTIGTVYYISPEQAQGEKIDHRSDLYSVGVTLFEMLTGRLPFDDEDPVKVALMQINDQPPSPRDLTPTIPIGLEQFVLYALAKDPDERFQSAEQMLEYLKVLYDDPFARFAESPGEQYRRIKEGKEREQQEKKEQEKPKKNVRHVRGDSWSPLPVILGVLTALFIVLAVSLIYAWSNIFEPSNLNFFTDKSGETVVIDNYIGKPFTEKDKSYIEDTLHYGVNSVTVEERYSEIVEKGYVIDQDPRPGEVRKLSSVKMTIVISKGSSAGVENIFPDYRMQDYRVLRLTLKEEGYDVVLIPTQSTTVEKNKVFKTDPAPGAKITEGTSKTVRLYYSVGPTADELICTFPKFVGMSVEEAQRFIDENNLNLVAAPTEYSDTVPAGHIISSSVIPGPHPRLTPLTLTVSLGPAPSGAHAEKPDGEDADLFHPEPDGETGV